MRIVVGLLLFTLASGCDEACTEIAVASVSLQVESGDGARPLPDAEVTFTLDGGPAREAEHLGDGEFVLAYEEAGTFEVQVGAPGHEQVERSYPIALAEDGCHVEPADEVIVLAVEE